MSELNVFLEVTDEAGAALPFRVDILRSAAETERIWSDSGHAALSLKPGAVKLNITRGINYDAAILQFDIPATGAVRKSVALKRRFIPRELGWYGGENHMHVLHDSSNAPRTFGDGARMAAADGLDYLQLAFGWEPTFSWVPAAKLDAQSRDATNEHVNIGWNIESPKSYMSADHGGRDGNLHCYGHGWTVGLKDNAQGRAFFHTGPNFHVIQEVNRQGGIVGCAHPVRFWFTDGNFTSNWPSELPFDFVAGAPYAAVDILNDGQPLFFESERFWYTLLNLGYKVAGTANSDGALASTPGLGRFRTYTHLGGEPFSWNALAKAMAAGRNVATSGPFVLFEVEGGLPGAEFPADGRPRRARVKAWSAPLPGETLTAVQLIRNGEVVRAWDLRAEKTREWATHFELSDDAFAWYAIRVLSSCRNEESLARYGESVCELAVANPIYFLPKNFARPTPEPAQLTLAVSDATTRHPISATLKIEVRVASRTIDTLEFNSAPEHALTVPATATLRISADGYKTAERCLYLACPELHEYCRNIGTVWPSFFTPEPYRELRRRLQNLKLAVRLERV
jgi:hypothetical protein